MINILTHMVTIDEDMNKVARSVDSDWNIVTPERVSKAFNMNTCSVPQIITCVISYNFLIQKLWSFHSLNKKLMLWWFGPPLPYQWQWWWGFFLYHYSRLSIHLTIINKHTWNNETLVKLFGPWLVLLEKITLRLHSRKIIPQR